MTIMVILSAHVINIVVVCLLSLVVITLSENIHHHFDISKLGHVVMIIPAYVINGLMCVDYAMLRSKSLKMFISILI